jgi:hypothetical protein
MKVYTSINEKSLATLVGVVMTTEDNAILFKDGFKLTIQDKVSAHTYGLKRCLSYIKSKDMHVEHITHKLHDNVRVDIDREMNDRINADPYIERFIQKGISITSTNKDLTQIDREMLSQANIEISLNNFKKGYER